MTSLLFIGNPPQTRGGIIQAVITNTDNGRILRGSATIRGGIKIFRGGIISGQVSGIAGGSEKSSAGVGGLVKIPLDCTVCHQTILLFHYENTPMQYTEIFKLQKVKEVEN